MTFQPRIALDALRPLLADVEERRQRIEALEVPPVLARWLRRITEARGAHMSTRIEGNPMAISVEQLIEILGALGVQLVLRDMAAQRPATPEPLASRAKSKQPRTDGEW